jgi:site-specific DNA recombinase
MKAVGYIRVSTAGQAEDGVSLDAQRAKIQAWAEVNDAELVEVFCDEGISGTKGSRPGLNQGLEYATEHGAALVVYSLSRLSRSTKDTLAIAERLDKAGADLVSMSERIDTTTAAGKMVFRMLAVLNEFERDQISERTKAALSFKKANGCKTGGYAPYGEDADNTGKLKPNDIEQAVIDRILELRTRGWNFSQIARELNRLGYRTKTGKAWYPQTVKNVLKKAA